MRLCLRVFFLLLCIFCCVCFTCRGSQSVNCLTILYPVLNHGIKYSNVEFSNRRLLVVVRCLKQTNTAATFFFLALLLKNCSLAGNSFNF